MRDVSRRLKGFEIRKSVQIIYRSPLNILIQVQINRKPYGSQIHLLVHISKIIVKVSNASLYSEERIADEKSIILIYVLGPMGAKESSQV